ncbi:tRNA (adenosine(37)-N6)-threonylcarbamoyltransferase complex ATPase subunit type 1 TsaE [bacterium]|nr:tRNA (adenosine(37)-N6)-threonylcarbamoyltransferase complex ATPase subunit type 1 TsaE [bacterium]
MNRTGTEEIEFFSSGPDDTRRTGASLAEFLKPDDVVALYGDLGSGKTVLAQGVCRGLGVTRPVTSPTYTLIQEYGGFLAGKGASDPPAEIKIYHFDFYRISSMREIEDLDPAGHFEAGGICLIEWADRGEMFLPESRLSVRLLRAGADPDRRRIILTVPVSRNIRLRS